MHPQTLRNYEKSGLVVPKRTIGGVRRYSSFDIERLNSIRVLTSSGVNIEGVRIILEQREELNILKRQLLAAKNDSIFTSSPSGITVDQYNKMNLLQRLKMMHKLSRSIRLLPHPTSPIFAPDRMLPNAPQE
jgi:DNA-binding transcriptional MerR regulator